MKKLILTTIASIFVSIATLADVTPAQEERARELLRQSIVNDVVEGMVRELSLEVLAGVTTAGTTHEINKLECVEAFPGDREICLLGIYSESSDEGGVQTEHYIELKVYSNSDDGVTRVEIAFLAG